MPLASSRSVRKRSYRSETRERRARQTRERILAAASVEFVRSGYAATTMRAVADAAGVSLPTVELVFGTKPQLLGAAISFAIRGDAGPIPMLEREWALRAEAAASVADFLAIVEPVLTEAAQRSAGLVVAAFEASQADESMRELADQLRTQRAETAAWVVDGLSRRSPLRAGLGRESAIDTVWLLIDPHGFCALTRDRGWTPEQFGRWFTDCVCRLLVGDKEPAAAATQHPRWFTIAAIHESQQAKEADTMRQPARQPSAASGEHGAETSLAMPGAITYLHIPAADTRRAAAFYREVFGWQINNPDSDRPSFDTPNGRLSGAWISDHLAPSEVGLLPYVYVDQVEDTVARILAHGGEIVSEPFSEGLLTIAIFRDPAGNVIGLWHDTTREAMAEAGKPLLKGDLQPELWVGNTAAAIAYYELAFGAVVEHRVGGPDDPNGVAQLSVSGARFWVAGTSEQLGRFNASSIGGGTARFLLVVGDPHSVVKRAVEAGGKLTSAVSEEHGWLLGRLDDPFGHEWEIGRPLGAWPPAN